MATSPNFNWPEPDNTDLVKNGALAIRTAVNAIDTSLVDLKGGTTGQILAKTSNTDMDFTWVANDVGDITGITASTPLTGGGTSGAITVGIQDGTTAQKGAVQLENSTSSTSTTTAAVPASVKSAYDLANAAIPKSLVDAAGDLIYATANDTPTRLALGTAGQVLTVNSGATAPEWKTSPTGAFFAPNLILNGAFIVNQRVYTSGTNLASGSYGFDRWKSNYTNTSLTFTAGVNDTTVTISSAGGLQQVIERENVPAGTYVLSWTGTATARVYNSGGTPPSYAASPVTFTADGLANVVVEFTASGGTKTLGLVKFERGSNATTYSLAGGTIQGELAACQRYYIRYNAADLSLGNYAQLSQTGFNVTTQLSNIPFASPVTMRTKPTSVDYANVEILDTQAISVVSGGTFTVANPTGTTTLLALYTHTAATLTTGKQIVVRNSNNVNGYFGWSAEL